MARHQDWPGCLGEQTFRSPVQMRGARDSESRAPAAFVSTRHSVVAGVGPGVCVVIGATQAVIVKTAASEMAPATAAACLGISGKKAAGKHGACQNHHHSSSHDFLLLGWAGPSATESRQPVACAKGKHQRRDGVEMEMIVCPLY